MPLYVQALTMWGTATSIGTELLRPRSPIAAGGRGFFAMLQGAWLLQIAHMFWQGAPPPPPPPPGGSRSTLPHYHHVQTIGVCIRLTSATGQSVS